MGNEGAGLGPWEALNLLAPGCILCRILALCLGSGIQLSIHISTGSSQRAEPEARVQSTSSSPHSVPTDLKAWGWLASGQGREEELIIAKGGGEKRQAVCQGSLVSQCFGGTQKFQRPTSLRDDVLTLGNGNMFRSLGPCRHEPMPKMLPPHPLLSFMHVHARIHMVLASSELTARISSLLPTYFKLTEKYAGFLFLQMRFHQLPAPTM